MKLFSKLGFVALMTGVLAFSNTALAQRGGQGGPGGRGGFDPAQMRERMADRYQEALEFSDDEWSVIKPMVMSIVEKQFGNRGRGFGGFGRGGNRGGQGGNRGGQGGGRGPRGPQEGPAADLQAALDSGDEGKIKSALAALRADRKKSATELANARKELRQVLTLKQEATAVMMGLLE